MALTLSSSVAFAEILSLRCDFTDNANRKVTTIFSIDRLEAEKVDAEGTLQFIIDGFAFPGIPARKTNDPASTIVIENGRIKTANVFIDVGRRRAFMESESKEKSAVLFDFSENISGGKIKTAECTDGTDSEKADSKKSEAESDQENN